MVRRALLSLLPLVLTIGATAQTASQNNVAAHLVQVGARKMFLNCTGSAFGPTVILEAGSGDSSEVWAAVQKQVEQFARVCSYDRLGAGKSDKLAAPHGANEIVDDLHQLLDAARLPQPYVLVGHLIGGIYVRKYAALYPTEVTGLVLLDSAHEEQFARVSQISPNGPSEFAPDSQRTNSVLRDSYRRTSGWSGISMGRWW